MNVYAGVLSFPSNLGQKINLWNTSYGIGIQSGTLYSRADRSGTLQGFAWYKGGTHATTATWKPEPADCG